jgi:hypothetical protein
MSDLAKVKALQAMVDFAEMIWQGVKYLMVLASGIWIGGLLMGTAQLESEYAYQDQINVLMEENERLNSEVAFQVSEMNSLMNQVNALTVMNARMYGELELQEAKGSRAWAAVSQTLSSYRDAVTGLWSEEVVIDPVPVYNDGIEGFVDHAGDVVSNSYDQVKEMTVEDIGETVTEGVADVTAETLKFFNGFNQ